MIAIGSGIAQLARQTVDVVSTLPHTSYDIRDFFWRKAVETGTEHLCEATYDVKGRAYLVIHLLDEGCPAPIRFKLQLVGRGELFIMTI